MFTCSYWLDFTLVQFILMVGPKMLSKCFVTLVQTYYNNWRLDGTMTQTCPDYFVTPGYDGYGQYHWLLACSLRLSLSDGAFGRHLGVCMQKRLFELVHKESLYGQASC